MNRWFHLNAFAAYAMRFNCLGAAVQWSDIFVAVVAGNTRIYILIVRIVVISTIERKNYGIHTILPFRLASCSFYSSVDEAILAMEHIVFCVRTHLCLCAEVHNAHLNSVESFRSCLVYHYCFGCWWCLWVRFLRSIQFLSTSMFSYTYKHMLFVFSKVKVSSMLSM